MHDRSSLRIACLGVFDTVGALGILFRQFKVFNRDTYEFHDVELCAITDVNLRALAVDEQRQSFEATLWRRSKFKNFNTAVEQVWFPGAHSDVGGGYLREELRARDEIAALDDLTLDWMLKRLKHYFPDFPASDAAWPPLAERQLRNRALALQHQSRTGVYRFWLRALRSLNNEPIRCRKVPFLGAISEINVGRDRHEEPTEELLHVSVLCRWQQQISIDSRCRVYGPKNLRGVIEKLAKFNDKTVLPIVDWDGTVLYPRLPVARETILRELGIHS